MGYTELGVGKDDAEMLVMGALKDAITYTVDTGEIPISNYIGAAATSAVDFEWRGKFLFFGEEYYLKDIKGSDTLYLLRARS